jgi:DNA end-binding protein Ku
VHGVLTGTYRGGIPPDSRAGSRRFPGFRERFLGERPAAVTEAVVTAARGLGVSPAEVALAWVRDLPGVTAPVIGARTVAQLRAGLASEALELPDEIRAADQINLGDTGHASDKELAMASMLVDSLSGDYDPGEFEDDYAAAVASLVDSKIAGGVVAEAPAAAADTGEVVDLLEALQRSVDRAKAARGEPVTGSSSAPTKPAPAKPAPAKPAAAKKTAAKKTAARKAG